MSAIKKICICAICIALCYALPVGLHPLGLGKLVSPMHIPVIICGLACGPAYGFVCAVSGLLLSTALTGMPDMMQMPAMLVELTVYAVLAGIVMRTVHMGSLLLNVILTLVPTILLGRIAGALAVGVFYVLGVFGVESFSFAEAFAIYFGQAIPTIAIQLIFIPLLVVTLKEEKLLKF